MSVRAVLIGSFVLSIILFASFFLFLNPKNPSNRDFKRSGTKKQVDTYLASWGPAGIALAKRNLAVDWLFIAVYCTLWISAGLYFHGRAPFPSLLITAIGLLGALFDIAENICLWMMLHGNTSEVAPAVCARVMQANFLCFVLALIGLIIAAAGSH
jgi:hypothetical protein